MGYQAKGEGREMETASPVIPGAANMRIVGEQEERIWAETCRALNKKGAVTFE
jgi:hypothetical protein